MRLKKLPVRKCSTYTNTHNFLKKHREEGKNHVKSSWPLWPGLQTCYNGNYKKQRKRKLEQIFKNCLSSDCRLQLAYMKLE